MQIQLNLFPGLRTRCSTTLAQRTMTSTLAAKADRFRSELPNDQMRQVRFKLFAMSNQDSLQKRNRWGGGYRNVSLVYCIIRPKDFGFLAFVPQVTSCLVVMAGENCLDRTGSFLCERGATATHENYVPAHCAKQHGMTIRPGTVCVVEFRTVQPLKLNSH